MTENDYSFQHLRTEDDLAEHLDLMRSVFGKEARVDVMVSKWRTHDSGITLNDFFVIKRRGKIVAALNTIPSKWFIDDTPVNVAELACVVTLAGHRNKGLQRRLMIEYHRQIVLQGYDLSAIEGIPYYYRQFGYEYAVPLDELTRIPLKDLPDYELKHEIRPFRKTDMLKAAELFDKSQKKFNVHAARDRKIWEMQESTRMISNDKFEAYSVETDGEMTAYVRVSHDPDSKILVIREATDVSRSVARSILQFLKNKGKQEKLETLAATVSHDEPIVKEMLSTGRTSSRQPYAWQIRVMDHLKLFRKLKPLFEKRLAESVYCDLTDTIHMNFYTFTIQMQIKNGKIARIEQSDSCEDGRIRLNPQVFIKLLLGYTTREELQLVFPDFIIHPSYAGAIDTLFPKMRSFIATCY